MSLNKKVVWLPYDFDTAIGTNNEGVLAFSYGLEDIDQFNNADVFNGQQSVFWKNIRAAFWDDLQTMWRSLRSTGAISYDVVESMFEEHQGKWPEAIFNEDSVFCYIEPLVNDGSGTYLPMLQGSKAEQRKWWLYNQFRYVDSEFNAGDALSDVIQLRGYAVSDITITPYADIYPSVKFGSYLVQERGSRNNPTTLTCPLASVNDTEIYIYSSSQLASVGDLSGLKVGLADFSMATRLQSIKIGDSDANYDNPNLSTLTLGNNVLLQSIDVRNCSGLTGTVDVSGCEILEHVYFGGTNITGLTLPVGGILKTLSLPDTITNLTVRDHPAVTAFAVENDDYSSITTLRIENCSDAIPVLDILPDMASGSRVRLINIELDISDVKTWSSETDEMDAVDAFYTVLETMRGLDESGNNTSSAVVSGTITGLGTITGSWLSTAQSRFPDVDIEYSHIESYLYYRDEDGTLLKTVTCTDGVPAEAGPSPTKADSADGHYSYTFAGWTKTEGSSTVDSDAATNVTADRDVYAVYTATVKTYTVTWKNSDGATLETDTGVAWGTVPSYDGSTPQNPTSGGGSFTTWTPTVAAITGDTVYVATYTPVYNVYFYNGTTLLQTVQVLEGGSATYTGSTPTDGDKIFTGWSPSPTNVTGNLSVYAQFKANVETPTATTADGAYGVEWDYSQSATALTRKGLAASFSDPAPATSVSGSGSSPFDPIAPWSDMKRYCLVNGTWVDDSDASFDETSRDTMVYIPEFYYTAYKDETNQKWLWAISPTALTGFCKHPGSGKYVGRFHTSGDSTAVYSKSGVVPLASTSQTNFRTYSAAKGSGWGILDLATWSAIQMLYLVEFADFQSQTTLGTGWTTGSVGTMGGTGSAAYHTIQASGAHNMYRWIEDPFSNVRDWIDGFMGSTSTVYAAANSSYAGGSSDLNQLGFALPSSGDITGFGYDEAAAWAFIPDSASGTDYTIYVCDRVNSNSSLCPAYVGGNYYASASYGLFYLRADYSASSTDADLGSRLLYKP